MAGISSKAAGGVENRYKFNEGTELNTDFDISLYETPHRGYDPQIGRFHQIDPLAEYAYDWSTYAFANNNPILLNDPSGLISDSAHKAIILPEVVVKNKPQSASDKVINGNWFIRFFAAREVRNAERGLDAYQREGLNGYLYTSIRNAHSESMLEFSTGGYINPWNRVTRLNKIPEGRFANHLFKGPGKLSDNPTNRALIEKVSNGKPLGVDPYGKIWYTGNDGHGKLIYSYTKNGVVKGAGYMTMSPQEMVIKYGLK